jgi:DNA-binding CsgD family transcriptional regulator
MTIMVKRMSQVQDVQHPQASCLASVRTNRTRSSIQVFWRYCLASISRGDGTHTESVGGVVSGELREPLAGTLSSLANLLRFSTIGVALFDGNFHCRALNGALRRMIGVCLKRPACRHLHEIFPSSTSKLELALRRVWTTGSSLSNIEWTAELPAGTEPRLWLMNFYPITDETGRVRLVATTFCEVTKGRCVELKLSRLRDKFQSHILHQPNHFEEEFSEISARTFDLVNRSVALLKNSLSLRFYTSETQLQAALVRHALHMTAKRVHESAHPHTLPHADAEIDSPSSQGTPKEADLPASCPSPREHQVLRFLADGKSNKEIGSILDISTRTVECYRARIMLKLDLHSTAALVRYAIRNHIVEA